MTNPQVRAVAGKLTVIVLSTKPARLQEEDRW